MTLFAKIKLGLLVGLILLTFSLGVKVTRDHYLAKEQAARIETLERDISARDVANKILRDAAQDASKKAAEDNERIRQYETYLSARPGDCTINSDDLRWMRPQRRPSTAPAR